MNEKQNLRLKRNVGLDYVHTFLSNMNMQSSIWVLYLAYCGMHLAQIGLLEGIYHATSIVCEIPSGAAADLLGRKRCMILSNICIAVFCVIILLSNSFGCFAVSFVVQALGHNFNSGSEEALVYDSMKCLGQEEHYMGVYGRLNVLIEVAQGLATVAGGALAEFSYFWCYAACVVIAVLALLPVLWMAEPTQCGEAADTAGEGVEDAAEGTPAQRTIRETVKHHFAVSACILQKDARIGKIIGFYSVVFAAHTLLFFYSQQYFADLGYNKVQISVIMLLVGGASCLGALVSEKMYRWFGKKCLIPETVIIAGAILCYGAGKAGVAIAALMCAGFANAALYPIQSDSLNALIPSEQRATLISVDSMCFSIVMIVLFPLAGALADRWGLKTVLLLLGVILLLFLLTVFCIEKESFSSDHS